MKGKNVIGIYQGLMSSTKYHDFGDSEGRSLLHLAVASGSSIAVTMTIFAGLDPS